MLKRVARLGLALGLVLAVGQGVAEPVAATPQPDRCIISNYPVVNGVRQMHKADLHGCDLSVADLRYADLTRADLSGANLAGAVMDFVDLTNADLSGANLTGADLDYANLTRADLRDANLLSTPLRFADLTRADLRGATGSPYGTDNAVWTHARCPDGFQADKASPPTCDGHFL